MQKVVAVEDEKSGCKVEFFWGFFGFKEYEFCFLISVQSDETGLFISEGANANGDGNSLIFAPITFFTFRHSDLSLPPLITPT